MKCASARLDTASGGKFLAAMLLALPALADVDLCGVWAQADSIFVARAAAGRTEVTRIYKGNPSAWRPEGGPGSYLVYAKSGVAIRVAPAAEPSEEMAFLNSLPKQGARVDGRVAREGSSHPVERALVTVVGNGKKVHSVSGDGGGFHIPELPPGEYTARVERAGYHPGQSVFSVTQGCAAPRIAIQPDAARIWLEDAMSSVRKVARAAYYAARDTIHSRKP